VNEKEGCPSAMGGNTAPSSLGGVGGGGGGGGGAGGGGDHGRNSIFDGPMIRLKTLACKETSRWCIGNETADPLG